MKWGAAPEIEWNKTRIVTRWLLFPRTMEGETRWLGWASWKQVWVSKGPFSHWADFFWIG